MLVLIQFSIANPHIFPEMIISRVKASESRKIVWRKMHSRVINVFKESVVTMTITKYILDLEVSLSVGKLFTSAPTIEKQVTKIIAED